MSNNIVSAPTNGKHRITKSLPPSPVNSEGGVGKLPVGHIVHESPHPSSGPSTDHSKPSDSEGRKNIRNCANLEVITTEYGGKATECCRDSDEDGLCHTGCTMNQKSVGLHCIPLSEPKYNKDASAGCFKVENGQCSPISNDPTCGMRNPDSPMSKLTLNECRAGSCYPDNIMCGNALAELPKHGDNTHKTHKLPTTVLDKMLENNGLERACSRDSSSLVVAISNLQDLIGNELSEYDKFVIETIVCGFAMQPPSTQELSKFPYSGQGPGKNPGLLSMIKSGQLQCFPQSNSRGKCSPASRYFVAGINNSSKVLKLISMFLGREDIKNLIVSGGELPLPFESDFVNVQSKFIDGNKLSPAEKRVYRQAIINYLLGMAYPCSVDESVRTLGDKFVSNLVNAMDRSPTSQPKKLSDTEVKAPLKIKVQSHPFNWNLFGVITGISVVFVLLVVGFVVVHKSRNK